MRACVKHDLRHYEAQLLEIVRLMRIYTFSSHPIGRVGAFANSSCSTGLAQTPTRRRHSSLPSSATHSLHARRTRRGIEPDAGIGDPKWHNTPSSAMSPSFFSHYADAYAKTHPLHVHLQVPTDHPAHHRFCTPRHATPTTPTLVPRTTTSRIRSCRQDPSNRSISIHTHERPRFPTAGKPGTVSGW